MADDLVVPALRALGRDVPAPVTELAGSHSGSGVWRVPVDGSDAVLKVTAADAGQPNARRELAFYRTLAGQVPVETPELLDYADNDEFTAILLSAHGAAIPAARWDLADWLELARQLAVLHSTPQPPADGAWFQHRPWTRSVLDQPRSRIAEEYWSRTEAAGWLVGLLDAIPEFARALDALPVCFVHGDCHVDNLLRDGRRIVWTDWQVVGLGSPAGDLAFVGSRANSDGADMPYDAMLREYASRSGIDLEPMRRAVAAAELGTMLFGWPYHVGDLTQGERDRLTRRMLQLAAYWNASR